jgi:hypothetical protein
VLAAWPEETTMWASNVVGGAFVLSLVMAGPTVEVGLFGVFWLGGAFSLSFGWWLC